MQANMMQQRDEERDEERERERRREQASENGGKWMMMLIDRRTSYDF